MNSKSAQVLNCFSGSFFHQHFTRGRYTMDVFRQGLLLLIRLYRHWISPLLPPSCRYQPTCSAYAEAAITKFGPLTGSWLAAKRILRCHPWSRGGYDPVPDCHGQAATDDSDPV